MKRRSRCDRADERLAVRLPTVLADGALAGGRAERPPQRRIGQALQRVGQPAGPRRIVQESLAPVLDSSDGMRSTDGATTGKPAAMYSKIFSGDQ